MASRFLQGWHIDVIVHDHQDGTQIPLTWVAAYIFTVGRSIIIIFILLLEGVLRWLVGFPTGNSRVHPRRQGRAGRQCSDGATLRRSLYFLVRG